MLRVTSGKDTVHEDIIGRHTYGIVKQEIYNPFGCGKAADALGSGNQELLLHEKLSDREFDVFKLLASGKAVSDIAEQLSLSVTTVSTYRSRVLEKMDMKSNADLTRYALDNKLI